MELRSELLPRFNVTLASKPTKPNSLLAPISFSRDTLPSQYDRCKNLEVHCNSDQGVQQLAVSLNGNSKLPELRFNRLQPTEQECDGQQRRSFGRFVAREAILDEEYWTAAWLRAEAHWESVSYMRHIDSYKRKYAEQEFYSLKRRCSGPEGNSLSCICIIAVKKEDKKVRRTVLNSVVGTLDLSIRQFLQGETYPGEVKKLSSVLANQGPFDTHRYAYIANVCVAKFARRQGVGANMMYLATETATMLGMRQLFVHVNADNKPAQDLYKKTGFKVVDAASSRLSKDQLFLMSMDL